MEAELFNFFTITHNAILNVLCYVSIDFRGQKGKYLTLHILKSRSILKCNDDTREEGRGENCMIIDTVNK